MLKMKLIAALCAVLILLASCAAKDDFTDYSVTEYPPIEYLSAETEFSEYDGNAEEIWVILSNHRDEAFHYDYEWWLEKEVDDGWRAIRFLKEREFDCLDRIMKHGSSEYIPCDLKGYVKQPLLPGHYRIWVGGEEGRVPAEFTIK